jgi:hypothetical protein
VLQGYPPLYFYGEDKFVWDFQVERKGVWDWFSSFWEKEEPTPRFNFGGGIVPHLQGSQEEPRPFNPYQ